MKSGYDQFFKNAHKVASQGQPTRANGSDNSRMKSSKRSTQNSYSDTANDRAGGARKVQSQDAKVLAQQLRNTMRPRIQKKAKRSFPWKLAGASLMGLLLTAGGLYKIDDVEKYAKRIEFSLLGTASAEEIEPKAAAKATPDKSKLDKAGAAAKAPEAPVVKTEYTDEDISHFSKLNERKRELDAREEELNRMEQELSLQKTDLEKRLTELEGTRRSISSVLDEKVQSDDKKVENLVQMYSNMKPQQAAKAFEEMDEGLAIEILGRMKKKNAAEIMNLVKSEKVKVLSEKYTGYKRN